MTGTQAQVHADPAVPTTGFRGRGLAISIRVVGLAAIVAWLARGEIELGATLDLIRGIDPMFYGAGLLLNLVPPCVMAFRLRILLRAAGHSLAYGELAGDSLRAAAINTVTIMGAGDLYRIQRLHARGVPVETGSALALLDRIFGVGSLVALVVLLQWTGVGQAIELSGAIVTTGIALAALSVGALLLSRTRAWLVGVAGGLRDRIAPSLDVTRLGASAIARLLAVSLVANVSWVLAVVVLGFGLGFEIGLAAYFDAAPLVALASFLPISIGGLGLREAGYVLLLAPYGVVAEEGVALGLAQYSTFLAVAVLGGLLFLRPGRAGSTRPHLHPDEGEVKP